MWTEVSTTKTENRRELVLTGKDIAKRIEENGFDENIYELTQLNFLEVTRSGLLLLSPKIGQLTNLTSLSLHCNKLDEIPVTISKLTKLKMLDISINNLSEVPEEIGTLLELQTLNVSGNNLTEFIDVSSLTKLQSLDISNNKLKELPPGIDNQELKLLMMLSALNNEIESLPDNLSALPSLKILDVCNNKLEELPPRLGECGKLKEFRGIGNKLKDGRLMKLVNQNLTKAILDYLKTKIVSDSGKGKAGKKNKKGGKGAEVEDDADKDLIKVLPFSSEKGLMVKITDSALKVRPFIVCCIVRNLNFLKSQSFMKRFIKIQTRLHEDVCNKRQVATIATHDLEKVQGPLLYDAVEPEKIKIQPLKKSKEVSAKNLVDKLVREAEETRKIKKRNTVSGVHKYLNLLTCHSLYPYIVDEKGVTISFPPIINCDSTKVTESTRHILIEVTGSSSLDSCKKVMEELLMYLLEMGVCQEEEPPLLAAPVNNQVTDDQPEEANAAASDDEVVTNEGQGKKLLILEQVRVVDRLNNLRVVYPSRTDLDSNKVKVARGQD